MPLTRVGSHHGRPIVARLKHAGIGKGVAEAPVAAAEKAVSQVAASVPTFGLINEAKKGPSLVAKLLGLFK